MQNISLMKLELYDNRITNKVISLLQHLLEHNKKIAPQLRAKRYWTAVAFVMSGVVANYSHALRDSFLALIPTIVKMTQHVKKEDMKPIQPKVGEFMRSLFFSNHLERRKLAFQSPKQAQPDSLSQSCAVNSLKSEKRQHINVVL